MLSIVVSTCGFPGMFYRFPGLLSNVLDEAVRCQDPEEDCGIFQLGSPEKVGFGTHEASILEIGCKNHKDLLLQRWP